MNSESDSSLPSVNEHGTSQDQQGLRNVSSFFIVIPTTFRYWSQALKEAQLREERAKRDLANLQKQLSASYISKKADRGRHISSSTAMPHSTASTAPASDADEVEIVSNVATEIGKLGKRFC